MGSLGMASKRNGTSAPSGTYSVQAIVNVSGKATSAQTDLEGTVSSVSLNASGGGVTLQHAAARRGCDDEC